MAKLLRGGLYAMRVSTCILFAVLILVVFGQVFWRYVLQSPLFWAEEFARILFIWLIMLALVISLHEGSQASVDFFTKLVFRNRLSKAFSSIFVHFSVLFFSLFLLIYGFKLSFFVREQVFPALEISYSIQYLAVPISSIFLVLISAMKILDAIPRQNGK
jgi:TRAP-type C4-dicarboxylate transport system permease small subunit